MNRLLENQLEEERQLSYSFGSSMNDKQNINAQEAKSTEEINTNNYDDKVEQPPKKGF
ncbi:hypothetical protein ACUXKH_001860 [Staphylococcus epidermidis]|uniref:hypothetical protein n=1 Tax=Staphylococcus epidermidis TaxID=1282 RepID=UPI003AB094F0